MRKRSITQLEIKRRILLASMVFEKLGNVSRNTNSHSQCVLPVLTYGDKTTSLTK